MHCKSCEKIIEDTVKELEGVGDIKISYATEIAEIEFDTSKTSSDTIVGAINEIGYEAREIEKEGQLSKDTGNQKRGLFNKLFGRK